MPSDHAELERELRAWILTKAPDLAEAGLTGRTPLFADRHLRSVHVPELLLLLERLRGSPIDVERLRPGDFTDLDTLIARFGSPS